MSIYLEDYPNLAVSLLKAKANSLNLLVNQPLKKALTLKYGTYAAAGVLPRYAAVMQ